MVADRLGVRDFKEEMDTFIQTHVLTAAEKKALFAKFPTSESFQEVRVSLTELFSGDGVTYKEVWEAALGYTHLVQVDPVLANFLLAIMTLGCQLAEDFEDGGAVSHPGSPEATPL